MKRILSALMAVCMMLSLAACGKYKSSYRAVGLVRSTTSHSFDVSFLSLDGEMVFKLKPSESDTDWHISYSVELEEGELIIYYDACGAKEKLIHAKAGDAIQDTSKGFSGEKSAYIIIEVKEKARGKISADVDN